MLVPSSSSLARTMRSVASARSFLAMLKTITQRASTSLAGKASPIIKGAFILIPWSWTCNSHRQEESTSHAGLSEMELAGLEPATSWVRYCVRKPNRADLSSLG